MNDFSTLLLTARKLLVDVPSHSDLRRAVSTAYYALFHQLCLHFCQISLPPVAPEFSATQIIAYRYIDHGNAKVRCLEVSNMPTKFAPQIVLFARTFVLLQQGRVEADYDPRARFMKFEVVNLVDESEKAILALASTTPEEQRAFVIFVALRQKGRA